MDNNKVFPYYQRKKPHGQDYLLSHTEEAPIPSPASRGKKLPLLAVLTLLIVLALCCLPWPTQVTYTLYGAEVDLEGNVIDSGTLVIEGRIYDYLFKTDKFQLTHLELPGCQVSAVVESVYPLYEMAPIPGNYHTFALIELSDYSFITHHQANVFFSEDQSCWIVAVMDRVFVGTTDRDPNYTQIMDFWGSHIDGFIGN